MNDQVKKVISDINKNSQGKAVILLVSDEGQYPKVMDQTFLSPVDAGVEDEDDAYNGGMADWSAKELQMKFGLLQAVHIPEATSNDLDQMSAVNMFRVVLNRYLGYEFDYLPNCQFAVLKSRQYWYDYFDATREVAGKESPVCKQYK
jgi:hypothetical protein